MRTCCRLPLSMVLCMTLALFVFEGTEVFLSRRERVTGAHWKGLLLSFLGLLPAVGGLVLLGRRAKLTVRLPV